MIVFEDLILLFFSSLKDLRRLEQRNGSLRRESDSRRPSIFLHSEGSQRSHNKIDENYREADFL